MPCLPSDRTDRVELRFFLSLNVLAPTGFVLYVSLRGDGVCISAVCFNPFALFKTSFYINLIELTFEKYVSQIMSRVRLFLLVKIIRLCDIFVFISELKNQMENNL